MAPRPTRPHYAGNSDASSTHLLHLVMMVASFIFVHGEFPEPMTESERSWTIGDV
jgi:hypothetical protein